MMAASKASLPRTEIVICFIVWATHSFMAFYITRNVCSRLAHMLYVEASDFVDGYYRDNTDYEWTNFKKSLGKILLVNISHGVLFRLCPLLLPKQLSQCLLLMFWIAAQVYLTSATCVITVSVVAFLVGILSHYWRSEPVIWLIMITYMVNITSIAYFSNTEEVFYREFNYYLYGALKILNFSIYLSRNKDATINLFVYFRYAQYMFYPPYSVILIVLFDDFDMQMTEVENDNWSCIKYKVLLLRLLRIIVWFVGFEALLHCIYVHALFTISSTLFNTLNEYELASVAYVNGKLFYIKYLLIFGIPSWFALADGMKPPKGPLCISRISKYSQMWRTFDRGLYQFLKRQVYVPVVNNCGCRNHSLRRFVAMVAVFMFVLVWHGTSLNYICWALLNGLELCFEWFGKTISKTAFWCKIQNFLGPRGEERFIAFSMLATVVPGIFGIFLFLSRKDIGFLIFRRLLIQLVSSFVQMIFNLPGRSLKFGMIAVHFFVLGYCFNIVCLEIEKHYSARNAAAKIKSN